MKDRNKWKDFSSERAKLFGANFKKRFNKFKDNGTKKKDIISHLNSIKKMGEKMGKKFTKDEENEIKTELEENKLFVRDDKYNIVINKNFSKIFDVRGFDMTGKIRIGKTSRDKLSNFFFLLTKKRRTKNKI